MPPMKTAEKPRRKHKMHTEVCTVCSFIEVKGYIGGKLFSLCSIDQLPARSKIPQMNRSSWETLTYPKLKLLGKIEIVWATANVI